MTDFLVVLITVGSEEEAVRMAQDLVESRLAACVNLVSPVRSFYFWEGKMADDSEWLLVVKTHRELFSSLEARVRELHSYQVPEILALPVWGGPQAYLDWVRKSTRKP